jgi:hypothetical protein
MSTQAMPCAVCGGTGRVAVPLGGALRAEDQAVLRARYDPATGAIIRRWSEVAALCGEHIERVRRRDVQTWGRLRRWAEAQEAGLPLTAAAVEALTTWHAVLAKQTYWGRYTATAAP